MKVSACCGPFFLSSPSPRVALLVQGGTVVYLRGLLCFFLPANSVPVFFLLFFLPFFLFLRIGGFDGRKLSQRMHRSQCFFQNPSSAFARAGCCAVLHAGCRTYRTEWQWRCDSVVCSRLSIDARLEMRRRSNCCGSRYHPSRDRIFSSSSFNSAVNPLGVLFYQLLLSVVHTFTTQNTIN